MRFLKRFLLFWLIMAPLFYLFGLPFLMGKLESKMKTDQYVQCQEHLKKEGLASILKTEQANSYCTCISDSVKLEKSDIYDMVRHVQPHQLFAKMRPIVDGCNETLKKAVNNTARSLPAPRTETQPDGTQIIHFN